MTMRQYDVIVIGAGPAGCMAALQACKRGLTVLIAESMTRPLNKLRISGKGRCNLTNAATGQEFLSNIVRGDRFFRSAFSSFDNVALMHFFEENGVPLKVERGQRVFPADDQAISIANALLRSVHIAGAELETNMRINSILINDRHIIGVKTANNEQINCGALVIATGGKSYPRTGSTGDGYRLAAQCGHTVTSLTPSLAPIQVEESWVKELEGLSLKNVGFRAVHKGKTVYSNQGEMLFTSNGVSGPLVLSASAHFPSWEDSRVVIDLKPALSEDKLDERLLREFTSHSNSMIRTVAGNLYPRSLVPIIVRLSGIAGDTPCNQIKKEQRKSLIALTKAFTLTVRSIGPIEQAIVTRGGIETKEVEPKTMRSRLVKNLSFAGELLDIDAYTGGFNLQIAFSTGYVAGLFCRTV